MKGKEGMKREQRNSRELEGDCIRECVSKGGNRAGPGRRKGKAEGLWSAKE